MCDLLLLFDLIARAQEFEEEDAALGLAIGKVDGSSTPPPPPPTETEGKPNRRTKPEKGEGKQKAKAKAKPRAKAEGDAAETPVPVSSDWREFLLSGENMDDKADMRRAKVRCTRANKAAEQKVAKGREAPRG